MKLLLKNYLLLNKLLFYKKSCKHFVLVAFLYCTVIGKTQVANYVNNGSFEDYFIYNISPMPYHWWATDTSKVFGELIIPAKIPLNNYTYQWPKSGKNYLISLQYCSTCSFNKRGYPRNRLKEPLKGGKTYCVTFYINLSNQSTHAISNFGAYFGDSTLDTIRKCNDPITYLTPQIINPVNNIITDTLNWIPITGTFVANGTEKYMLIGNFKSDANTNTVFTNTTNLPSNFADYLIDAVSCIEADAPAYAGPDKKILAGDSVYLGRERDFAIDPYCVWYQLPSMSTIDTTSGIYVKPTVTTTYVVKQNLECGSLKWDTVVVWVDYTGNVEFKMINDKLKLYPNPANEILNVDCEILNAENSKIEILNSLGQMVREEELIFKDGKAIINVKDLENGVYVLTVSLRGTRSLESTDSSLGRSDNGVKVCRKFVVNR